MHLLVKDLRKWHSKNVPDQSLLKSSNISTIKITIIELKLISVSFTTINLFLLV